MTALTCSFAWERVTGVEPPLSARESVPFGPVTWPDLRIGLSASGRERLLVTGVIGPLMARRPGVAVNRSRAAFKGESLVLIWASAQVEHHRAKWRRAD